ncbi:hypothetical protein [Enterobacter roggenkampii]|uniref:hypothetical protein n=1 Tax=Enterobacter roggenkampii TaxID=1812935 RepID=UPI001F30B26F|nr:hypothetical protein [Enterobacter roggenkampii]
MSDVINPRSFPEQAAQQVIIELIRANKLSTGDGGVALLQLFEKLKKHYELLAQQDE